MINCIQKTDYDAINDILYINFTKPSTDLTYGDEPTDGLVIMRNYETDSITGLIIFYPKRDMQRRESDLKRYGFSIELSKYVN